jgi:hypothetical protein
LVDILVVSSSNLVSIRLRQAASLVGPDDCLFERGWVGGKNSLKVKIHMPPVTVKSFSRETVVERT